jgi:hypothetical protein
LVATSLPERCQFGSDVSKRINRVRRAEGGARDRLAG